MDRPAAANRCSAGCMEDNAEAGPKLLAGGRQGSQLLWIAPSGGRDRPNAEGVWMPSPFDASSVELMRQLLAQVGEFFNLYSPAL